MHDLPPPPLKHFHFNIAGIIKLPSNPGVEVAYADLVCTEQDKTHIIEVINSVADNGKFALYLIQDHLKNIEAQIIHVHPFKFLAVALSSAHLKSCLVSIFEDYFKRTEFMDGLGKSLTREADKKKIESYLPSFAEEIGVPAESMQTYIQSRDWYGLVQFLIHT
jgi:hypothetical protein